MPDTVERFLPLLSDFDRAEMERHGGAAMLQQAIGRSCYTFAGDVDGSPAWIGGVIADDDTGRVWMMANPLVERAKKQYLRETRQHTLAMQALFPRLCAVVDERYTKSLRWLEWLGFKPVLKDEVMGVDVVLFERVA